MGYKSNEYEKKKLNKKYKTKNRKEKSEKNEDILLRKLQEFNRLCDADS